jgi:hypothetical protein
VGDCTVGEDDPDKIENTIGTIEELGLPLVVLYAPGFSGRRSWPR